MKTVLRISAAILLSSLVAGGVWQVAHAPRDETVILLPPPSSALVQVQVTGTVASPDSERDSVAALENTPPVIPDSALMDIHTAVPDGMDELPEIRPTNAVSSTNTNSCSDGAVGSGIFVWPAENHYLSGSDYSPAHPGIDIAAGEGSPVYTADSGVVIAMGNDEAGYGNVIQIEHGNGYLTVYAHLSVIGVSMCQSVHAGQWIGAAGNTGNSRGVHLHFEVVHDGWFTDPWLVLP
jgi:murein DD-endopeptidase MepM/ murein hydrolase activator NlpD